MKNNIRYKIYSEYNDEAEMTSWKVGKWKLIWLIISNGLYKDTYSRRNTFEITIQKVEKRGCIYHPKRSVGNG